MSKDWVQDINDMHTKFGVRKWVNEQIQFGEKEKLEKFLEFRLKFLEEELNETRAAAIMDKNPEEIVDRNGECRPCSDYETVSANGKACVRPACNDRQIILKNGEC